MLYHPGRAKLSLGCPPAASGLSPSLAFSKCLEAPTGREPAGRSSGQWVLKPALWSPVWVSWGPWLKGTGPREQCWPGSKARKMPTRLLCNLRQSQPLSVPRLPSVGLPRSYLPASPAQPSQYSLSISCMPGTRCCGYSRGGGNSHFRTCAFLLLLLSD